MRDAELMLGLMCDVHMSSEMDPEDVEGVMQRLVRVLRRTYGLHPVVSDGDRLTVACPTADALFAAGFALQAAAAGKSAQLHLGASVIADWAGERTQNSSLVTLRRITDQSRPGELLVEGAVQRLGRGVEHVDFREPRRLSEEDPRSPTVWSASKADVVSAGRVVGGVAVEAGDLRRPRDFRRLLDRYDGLRRGRHVSDRLRELTSNDEGGCVLVSGPPGAGKTAVLAALVLPDRTSPHYFFSWARAITDAEDCILTLLLKLRSRHGHEDASLSLQAEERRKALQALLDEVSDSGARELIVVDGLDQADPRDGPSILQMLPLDPVPGIHWVFGCREDTPAFEIAARRCGERLLRLAPDSEWNVEDAATYLQRELAYCSPSKTLSLRLARKGRANFLYLNHFCERARGARAAAGELENLMDKTRGPEKHYRDWWQQVRQMLGTADRRLLARKVLGCSAVARRPLSVRDMALLLKCDPAQIDDVLEVIGPYLPEDPTHDPPCRIFYHDSFGEFCRKQFRADLPDHYQSFAARLWGDYQNEALDRDGIDDVLYYLVKAGRNKDVVRVLSDQRFVERKLARRGPTAVVRDMAEARAVPSGPSALSRALVAVISRGKKAAFWPRFRSALTERFGRYSQWPWPLKVELARSGSLAVRFFLSDTLDMGGRHGDAASILEGIRAETHDHDHDIYATACDKLIQAYDHWGRLEAGLKVAKDLLKESGAKKRYGDRYWWILYQKGILLRRLRRYDEARKVLRLTRRRKRPKGIGVSSLHQLGVVDLECCDLKGAGKTFRRCLQLRPRGKENHRRAFEYRRLGQVLALSGRTKQARKAFKAAIRISSHCSQWKYVDETKEDMCRFLDGTGGG